MAEDDDDAQKTEEPSRKRLDDALGKGQVITSRETSSFSILLAFTLLFIWMAPTLFRKAQFSLAMFIERPESFGMRAEDVGEILISLIFTCANILIVPFMAFIVAIAAVNIVQNRFVFSVDPILPSFDKISPIAGFGRLFSMRSVTELAKSILKIALTGFVAYNAVAPYFVALQQLPGLSLSGMLAYLILTAKRMLIGICIVMFFIALFDYLYQRFEYYKNLRMTKQEVKDEYKQQEGSPEVKRRLRQVRLDRARRRMMSAVPTADVIVTNPTHYSIALKYDAATMKAPVVVAKGLDNIALRIREIAKEHDIPIYESPPLAQALYASVELDQEVPVEHYKAVAEVISYIYRLQGRATRPNR